MTQPDEAAMHQVRDILQRCANGIDHLSELCRLWEPDHSTGSERRRWVLANDARDEARLWLTRWEKP